MKRMVELIEKLQAACRAYYSGEPIMSDEEYDLLYDRLKLMEDALGFVYGDSPTINVGSPILEELVPVKLVDRPMLSLDKVHSAEEVVKFSQGQSLVASIKCDGLSTRLIYENGELVQACTRGNGEVGVDVTEHIKHYTNVPIYIPFKKRLIVDGESIIKNKDFEIINSNGNIKILVI